MMQTHGEAPIRDQVPAEWHDRIMHVRLEVGEQAIMGSHARPRPSASLKRSPKAGG
jgi:PhnB protein